MSRPEPGADTGKVSQNPAPRASLGTLVPFAAPILGGSLVALVSAGSEGHPVWMALAVLLLALTGASAALMVWGRLPRPLDLVPPLACVAAVAAVRVAAPGSGPASGALFLVPLVWLALHGTRAQLASGLATAAGALVLSGPLQAEGLVDALPLVLTAPVVCGTIHRLVAKTGRQAAMIEEMARRDALTGTVTERAWAELVDREIVRAERSGETLTVALLDIDSLSEYNERFGPDAGDDLLRSTAAAWQRELRGGDILGRIEGDSFATLLPACDAASGEVVAERLRTATSELQTCSIGIAQWQPGENREHVMYRVRAALRRAKDAGRDRVVVATLDLSEHREPAPLEASVEALDDTLAQVDVPHGARAHEEPAHEEPAPEPAAAEDDVDIAVVAPQTNHDDGTAQVTVEDDASTLRQLLRELSSTH